MNYNEFLDMNLFELSEWYKVLSLELLTVDTYEKFIGLQDMLTYINKASDYKLRDNEIEIYDVSTTAIYDHVFDRGY